MDKYHCYEKGTDLFICTLYTYTDVLQLQTFLQEKGSDLEIKPIKMSKKLTKKIFNTKS